MAYYSVTGWSVRTVVGGKRSSKDVQGKWSVGEPDSLEARARVLEEVRRHLGVDQWDDAKIDVGLSGIVPPGFQPENRAGLFNAMAAYRAKCVVTLRPRAGVDDWFDRCSRLESHLAEVLEADDQGFVDGNDVGGGEFRVFCYGKRKPALMSLVREVVGDPDWAKVSLR